MPTVPLRLLFYSCFNSMYFSSSSFSILRHLFGFMRLVPLLVFLPLYPSWRRVSLWLLKNELSLKPHAGDARPRVLIIRWMSSQLLFVLFSWVLLFSCMTVGHSILRRIRSAIGIRDQPGCAKLVHFGAAVPVCISHLDLFHKFCPRA